MTDKNYNRENCEIFSKKLPEVSFRRMERQDLDAAALLEQQNFSIPWKKKDFETAISREDTVYMVAVADGLLAGCCGVRNIAGEGEITNVSVRRELRGQKIGTRMLAALMEEGRKLGIGAFTLEVRSGNASAVSMYKGLGFVTEGVRRNFYKMPVEDALIMWKR